MPALQVPMRDKINRIGRNVPQNHRQQQSGAFLESCWPFAARFEATTSSGSIRTLGARHPNIRALTGGTGLPAWRSSCTAMRRRMSAILASSAAAFFAWRHAGLISDTRSGSGVGVDIAVGKVWVRNSVCVNVKPGSGSGSSRRRFCEQGQAVALDSLAIPAMRCTGR